MPDRVNVGVIGTSWWADMMHLPSLKSHPSALVAAICGQNQQRAEKIASKYGIPSVYTDYREMIDKGNIQALVVITPEDMHHPMTMAALDANLHILCEKPLALTSGQAKEMYEKAEDAGVKHMTFFTYRWLPHYRFLKELVDEGYIGRCYHCSIRYMAASGLGSDYRWAFDSQRSTGSLGGYGSHMIDLARWLIGDIVKVAGHLGFYADRKDPTGQEIDSANDTAMLTVEFENGTQGSIHVSSLKHTGDRGQEQHVILCGESGTLEADLSFLGTEIRGIRSDSNQFETLAIPNRFWGDANRTDSAFSQLREIFTKHLVGDRLFIDSICEDLPITPSFYDGLKAQEVIDAAIESHNKGRWISLQ